MNESGIHPVEYKVLVKPDKVDENLSKKEGVIIYTTEINREKEQWKTSEGLLVAVGGMAFHDGFERWKDPIPQVGQRILYTEYAGSNRTGKDGDEYTIINDKDVQAIVEE